MFDGVKGNWPNPQGDLQSLDWNGGVQFCIHAV